MTMTSRSFCVQKKKTPFVHLHLLHKHFDPHTRLLRKGDEKTNVSCLDLDLFPDTSMGINDSSMIYGEAE